MTFPELLDALEACALSRQIAAANHLVTAGLQVAHILGFVLLLASAVLLALRVFGVVFSDSALPAIVRDTRRLIVLGLTLAVATGTVMVIGAPHHYFGNPAFQLKLIFFALAATVQFGTLVYLGRASPRAALVRIGVSVSAALWLSVSIAGRAIGFV